MFSQVRPDHLATLVRVELRRSVPFVLRIALATVVLGVMFTVAGKGQPDTFAAVLIGGCFGYVLWLHNSGERGEMAPIRMTQVTALVLRAVARGHRHGFDIMEACGLPSGTVYPALRRMDEAGLLRSGWEDAEKAHAKGRPRRRTYALAAAGRAALGEADAKLDEVRRLLAELGPTAVEEA